MRYSQLMRQQEKMIQDMEKAVYRRETIIEKYACSKSSTRTMQPSLYFLKYTFCACIVGEQRRQRVASRRTLKVISRRESSTCSASSNKLIKTVLSEFDAPCVTTACLNGTLECCIGSLSCIVLLFSCNKTA